MRLPRRQVPPGKNMRIYLSSSYNGFSRHNTIDYYDPSSQIKFSGELYSISITTNNIHTNCCGYCVNDVIHDL